MYGRHGEQLHPAQGERRFSGSRLRRSHAEGSREARRDPDQRSHALDRSGGSADRLGAWDGLSGRKRRSQMADGDSLTLEEARHLLRRTGFGASQATAASFLADNPTRGEAANTLLDFKPAGFKPGGREFEDIHDKWVEVHAEGEEPAAGEAGALLARSLRDRVLEGSGCQTDVGAEPALPPELQGQFQDAREGGEPRSGDDGVPRYRPEPRRDPQRELCARAPGALHARREGFGRDRQLRAGRRGADRARLHRLGLRQGRLLQGLRPRRRWFRNGLPSRAWAEGDLQDDWRLRPGRHELR